MSGHHADAARTAAGRAPSPAHPAALPAVREVLQSPGRSLEATLRGAMERGFSAPAASIRGSGGSDAAESEADRAADTAARAQTPSGNAGPACVDFSHVRLHTGPAAAASAQLIGAKAYASGSHVVLDDRRASLASTEGRHTLAHELAHVVQRVGARPVSANVPRPYDGHVARKEEYPILHQEILQKLIKIAKQHKNDGPERIPALRELAKSVPEKFRPGLFQRLSKPKGQDAFTDYVLINFTKTRDSFIEALALGNTPKADAAQAEEIVVPPKPTGPPASKEGSTFVTYDFQTVKGDPQYIDNFTNDANDAWFPNERVLVLQYPNGAVLRIALADVIKALDLKSELNPGYEPPEKLKKQIEEGEKSGDLVLPRIKGDKDGFTLMTIENKTSFHRDGESQVIYPQRSRIPKSYLPRLAKMVEQIESVRVNTELWMKAAPKLLEIVANMNWSAPRGMGGLIVATGRRIKKAAQSLKGVVIKPKMAPPKPTVQPPADAAKATPNKAATSTAAEGMPEITVSKGAKPKPPAGNLVEDVNSDTKALFERRPDLKKALERSPRAARALKKCASPCFPDMDTKQVERLDQMLEEAENAGIFFNDKQITAFLRSKTTPKEIDDALTEMKKALDRAKGVRGEQGQAAAQLGGDGTTPKGRDATTIARNTPGQVSGGEKLPDVTGQWFPPVRGTGGAPVPGSKDIRVAQIPGQIARKLRAIGHFKSFKEFRETFWKLVAQDPVLRQGWSKGNLSAMRDGKPPGAGRSHLGRSEQTGGGSNAVYNLDHKQSIENGGGVYDLDNIQVLSPRFHAEVGE